MTEPDPSQVVRALAANDRDVVAAAPTRIIGAALLIILGPPGGDETMSQTQAVLVRRGALAILERQAITAIEHAVASSLVLASALALDIPVGVEVEVEVEYPEDPETFRPEHN